MSTARDLIEGSLRLLGAIAQGESPSAKEASDALTSLNDMIADWSNQNLLIFDKVNETFPLVAGQQNYTMGVGGNFNTSRPLKIENALLQVLTGSFTAEFPIEIYNQDQWADITIKAVQSNIPRKLYQAGSYPLETISLWPVPSAANNIVLWSWKPLTAVASIGSTIDLPPGYAKALRYNLALELAPEYGIEPSQLVVAQAVESRSNIKRMNIKPMYLAVDEALLSRDKRAFNWLTGE